jgi:hypothetical protein
MDQSFAKELQKSLGEYIHLLAKFKCFSREEVKRKEERNVQLLVVDWPKYRARRAIER